MKEVYFAPIQLKDDTKKIEKAVLTLFQKTGFPERLSKNDLVAIKIHFGEEGNIGHINPRYAAVISKELLRCGAKPFFTDTNTLYFGRRANAVDHLMLAYEHGFTPDILNAPVIIADGLYGNSEVIVEINGKYYKEVGIAREIAYADAIVNLAHFTGHLVTYYGAALKNLGMGCSSRKGKLNQHSSVNPSVIEDKCTGCLVCMQWCPTNSISERNGIAFIEQSTCTGCGQCLSVCKFDAIYYNWGVSSEVVQEKMIEHVAGVLKNKNGKATHMIFLTHITKECDCLAKDEHPLINDIGILASNDPVAIDKAALDLIKEKEGIDFGSISKRNHLPLSQISYAEYLGLGSSDYKLKVVNI
jgi:uncharacterized Fe-S center protein